MIRVALVALALSSASGAFAQGEPQQQGEDASGRRRACHEDVQKLCAGIERGGGHILECLAANKDKLSDECRKRVEARGK